MRSRAIDLFRVALFCCWLVAMIANTTLFATYLTGGPLYAIRATCLVPALVVAVACGRYGARDLLVLLLVGLAAYTLWRSSRLIVLDGVLWLLALRDIPLRSLLGASAVVLSACLVLTILCSQVGLIDDFVNVSSEGRVRHYLGFRHALYAPQYLFAVTLCALLSVRRDRVRAWACVLLVANLAVFRMTDSRLSFCLSLAFVAVAFVTRGEPSVLGRSRVARALCVCSFAACAVASVAVTAAYDSGNALLAFLNSDEMLGGRLSLGSTALDRYGVSLLGQPVDLIGNGLDLDGAWRRSGTYNYIDSLYVQLLVRYGLVFGLILLGVMTRAVSWSLACGDWLLCLGLCIVAVHCMVDDLSLQLYFDPLLLAAASPLGDRRGRPALLRDAPAGEAR